MPCYLVTWLGPVSYIVTVVFLPFCKGTCNWLTPSLLSLSCTTTSHQPEVAVHALQIHNIVFTTPRVRRQPKNKIFTANLYRKVLFHLPATAASQQSTPTQAEHRTRVALCSALQWAWLGGEQSNVSYRGAGGGVVDESKGWPVRKCRPRSMYRN